MFFVWLGVRACLAFVFLASFVKVCMIMMSFALKVSCLIFLNVCVRVNVCWGLMLWVLLMLLFLLLFLMLLMLFEISAAVRFFKLLSWKT